MQPTNAAGAQALVFTYKWKVCAVILKKSGQVFQIIWWYTEFKQPKLMTQVTRP